jgi:hypothetical protein
VDPADVADHVDESLTRSALEQMAACDPPADVLRY